MNMRPGAFIEHSITNSAMPYKAKGIAIIAKGGTHLSLKKITSKSDTNTHFSQDSNARRMISQIQDNVFCDIFAIGLDPISATTDSYKQAIDMILTQSDCYCIVTDIDSQPLTIYAKERLVQLAVDKLFFSGCSCQSDIITYAKSLNHERICLTAPAICDTDSDLDYSPLILAIMLVSRNSLAQNLAGELVNGTFLTPQNLSEDDKNDYLYNGISVFEPIVESIYLIRAMTTKTLDSSQNYDCTYRNISVIVSADTTKKTLFDALSARLSNTNPVSSTDAVLSLIIAELETLQDKNIISKYDRPVITLDDADSSICNIAISVTIMQGINQIYLHLNMQV